EPATLAFEVTQDSLELDDLLSREVSTAAEARLEQGVGTLALRLRHVADAESLARERLDGNEVEPEPLVGIEHERGLSALPRVERREEGLRRLGHAPDVSCRIGLGARSGEDDEGEREREGEPGTCGEERFHVRSLRKASAAARDPAAEIHHAAPGAGRQAARRAVVGRPRVRAQPVRRSAHPYTRALPMRSAAASPIWIMGVR